MTVKILKITLLFTLYLSFSHAQDIKNFFTPLSQNNKVVLTQFKNGTPNKIIHKYFRTNPENEIDVLEAHFDYFKKETEEKHLLHLAKKTYKVETNKIILSEEVKIGSSKYTTCRDTKLKDTFSFKSSKMRIGSFEILLMPPDSSQRINWENSHSSTPTKFSAKKTTLKVKGHKKEALKVTKTRLFKNVDSVIGNYKEYKKSMNDSLIQNSSEIMVRDYTKYKKGLPDPDSSFQNNAQRLDSLNFGERQFFTLKKEAVFKIKYIKGFGLFEQAFYNKNDHCKLELSVKALVESINRYFNAFETLKNLNFKNIDPLSDVAKAERSKALTIFLSTSK